MKTKSMKKLLTTALVTAMLALSLTACGKKEEELTPEQQEQLEEMIEMREELFEDAENNTNDGKAQPPKVEGYKLYDRAPELDEVENPLLAVQIDDKVYEIGMTVAEVLKNIETSEVEYEVVYDEYSIEPGDMVSAGDVYSLTVERDRVNWFTFYFYNPADEATIVEDCICTEFYTYDYSSFPYCRYLGLEPDELAAINKDNWNSLTDAGNVLEGFKTEVNSPGSYKKDIELMINGTPTVMHCSIWFEYNGSGTPIDCHVKVSPID